MSVLATRPAPVRRAKAGRPRIARLRTVPDDVRSVTVTISVDTVGSPEGERVLAALRDLVAAAGSVVLVPHESDDTAAADDALRLDPRSRIATRDGRPLDLSRLEFDLLLFFARHRREVFSRNQLLLQVWGHKHTTNRTVDVHISRLRSKVGDPDVITTVYGVGYRLTDDSPIVVGEA
jgi:DNA-binding response OmpR family regulator